MLGGVRLLYLLLADLQKFNQTFPNGSFILWPLVTSREQPILECSAPTDRVLICLTKLQGPKYI